MIPYTSQSRGFFHKLAESGEEGLSDGIKKQYLNDTNRRRMPVVTRLAEKYDATINQIALAYLLSQPSLTVPIIGVRNPQQLADSVGALDVPLTEDELSQLREA